MKTLLASVLVIALLQCHAQKHPTTWLDGITIPDSLHISEVSSDTALMKICFTAAGGKKHLTYVLISERYDLKNWSKPYVALTLRGNSVHARINADGNRIFFVKDNDDFRGEGGKEIPAGVATGFFMGVYAADLISEKTWSAPHFLDDYFKFGEPPNSLSISPDERSLIFSNLGLKRSEPELMIYSCVKNDQNKWVESGRLAIKGVVLAKKINTNITKSGDIIHQNNTSVMINAADGSYLASFDGKTVGAPKKIEYYGGALHWINPSGSTAITMTARPFRIGLVQLRPTEPVVLSKAMPEQKVRDDKSAAGEESRIVKPSGKYYAVLIGVSDYGRNALNLERPVKDITELRQLLTNRYLFDSANVQSLINPTRQQIINLLFKLRSKIGQDDNLFIFYAGHGYYDQTIKQGYWWPKDASPEDPSNWLSNSDLREQIRGIKSAHTLLVSDACFSGGIFRTRGIEELRTASRDIILLYRTPSRRAITSGNLSSVPDRSVFFEYLVKRLSENPEKYLPSQQLFAQLKPAVMNNSNTVPQDGIIMDAGDEGGDFIFIKK